MALATIDIHSQAGTRQEGFATSGQLLAGTGSLWEELRWAIRFKLPNDFDASADVASATLNLWATASPGNYRIYVAASSNPSQTLPANGTEMFSAGTMTAVKYLGTATSSPAPDYVLGGSYAPVSIDVKAMVNEARAAGYLAGGYIAFISSNSGVGSSQIINAHGIGQANPPTLSLNYSTAAGLTIQSAQVPPSGDQLIVTLSGDATVTGTGSLGFAITPTGEAAGGPVTASYVSGSGTNTLVFALSRVILGQEQADLAYSGSAVTSGVTPLTAFSAWPIAIHSTQGGGPPEVPAVPLVIAGGAGEPRVSAWIGGDSAPVMLASAAAEPYTSASLAGVNSLIITSAVPGESQSTRIRLDWLPSKSPAVRLHRSLIAIQLLLDEDMGFDSVRCENQDGSVIPSFVRAWSPDDRRLKIMVQPHHLPSDPAPIYVNLITEVE